MYSFISLITIIWILFPDYDKNSKLKFLGGTNIGDIQRSSELWYLLNINLSANCWYVNFMYVLPIDLWIIVVFFAQMFLLSWTHIFFHKIFYFNFTQVYHRCFHMQTVTHMIRLLRYLMTSLTSSSIHHVCVLNNAGDAADTPTLCANLRKQKLKHCRYVKSMRGSLFVKHWTRKISGFPNSFKPINAMKNPAWIGIGYKM